MKLSPLHFFKVHRQFLPKHLTSHSPHTKLLINMGSPPKYEQLASDDVYDHVGDVEAGLTNSTAEGADSVIYTYAPLFPRKGKTEHIVGLRGKNRQVSPRITLAVVCSKGCDSSRPLLTLAGNHRHGPPILPLIDLDVIRPTRIRSPRPCYPPSSRTKSHPPQRLSRRGMGYCSGRGLGWVREECSF